MSAYAALVVVVVMLLPDSTIFRSLMKMPAHYSGFLCDYGIPYLTDGMNVVPMNYLNSQSEWNLPVQSIVAIVGAVSFTPQIISLVCIKKILGAIDSRAYHCCRCHCIHHCQRYRVIEIRVRWLHIQLFRALIIQFATPFLFSFIPFTFCALLLATGRTFGIAGNMIALSASIFPALDPILKILSVIRFRSALQQWMDVITRRTALRNEEQALEKSRAHRSMIRKNALSIFLYSAFSVSLFGNGLLLVLLVNKTGKALGNYRYLLAVFAITDIFTSTFHMWYIPMFILGKFGFVYFGPSFVKDKFHLFMICAAIYSITFVASIAFLSHIGNTMGVSQRFSGYLSEYGIRRLNAEMNIDAIEYLCTVFLQDEDYNIRFRACFIILCAGMIGGHSIVISIICILKIFAAFHDRVFEIRVRRLHIQLFRSLLLQFSIPFVFSFLPFTAIALLPATGFSFEHIGNFCGLSASLFPALDPILIILSINKFRSAIIEWMDVITGRKYARNERKEMERSRAYDATVKPKTTQTVYKRIFFGRHKQTTNPNTN
ncbi:hypothetical protein PRIPAC_81087 [Pristionchus pacificus]|uniref:G protein-coupled receptor n=1 Tax=Pristionchus pacificus TaxID=54126 RepID=A0A2A6CPW1_PRIPA|nr:hypothetical protein PRIPAC_81087 [Pristionchus pacificus]|eukprot:PDM80083.1 G protein-coupled receptor [Pristionchus pacificus]